MTATWSILGALVKKGKHQYAPILVAYYFVSKAFFFTIRKYYKEYDISYSMNFVLCLLSIFKT